MNETTDRLVAECILAKLRHAGVTLRMDGGRLLASPADKLTDADRKSVRLYKGELIELLPGPA
jgi:hypothetical protein